MSETPPPDLPTDAPTPDVPAASGAAEAQADDGDGQDSRSTAWARSAPWFLTVGAATSLVVIGLFLWLNVEWFKESAFPDLSPTTEASLTESSAVSALESPHYRLRLYHLHISMVKRSVGLFTGFALLFVGLGVAFYTLRTATELGVKAPTLTARLATASPGLVAVVVGATIIVATIASKDTFPPPILGEFDPPGTSVEPMTIPDYPASVEADTTGSPS